MNHLLAWLTDNVRNAAAKCGARGASVYVPTPWNEAAPGLLVHVGSEPLPELADMERACDFARQADPWYGDHATNDRELMVLPSAVPEGCLIPIPMLAGHWRPASSDRPEPGSAESRKRRLADERAAPPTVGWLGLRFAEGPGPLYFAGGWQSLLELASALASTYVCFYGIVTDPVTGLPGRAELLGTLRAEIERAQATHRPFSLLFVKLGELDEIAQTSGRRVADAVLREFIDRLQQTLRSSDMIMRYAASVLALPLRDVSSMGAMIVAEKIRQRVLRQAFLDLGLRVSCAIGVVSSADGSATPEPLDVLRRADQALAASCRSADCRPVLWRADGDLSNAEPFDPLLGVFTGQTETDYRNMRLLWDVLQVLAKDGGGELAPAAVSRIFSLFGAVRVALLQPDDRHTLQLVAGRQQAPGVSEPGALTLDELTTDERALNARAFATGEPQFGTLDGAAWRWAPMSLASLALPLMVERRPFGTLYLVSPAEARRLEHSDLPVLTGVATQLALALDHARLAAQQRIRGEQEEARLRAEVDRLQTAVQRAKLVFRSEAMATLLDTTRRVATTDATVLVTGESGTGKEMLVHTLHSLSPRHDHPLVIVDCGAIPASLIDSELFGRERGAYTGAERRAAGRLAQADGGTVFLDEVGELPLEVQTKLLRFVQEHTVTMVGSTSARRIDVRIIAATNRDLEEEVRGGRFREDLFHRLNVVRLRIPPLRERRDDVPLLARHFLDVFAMQYGKAVRGFAPDAEARLAAHTWTGNVRELQNTILQAVVLARSERITAEDLRIPDEAPPSTAATPAMARADENGGASASAGVAALRMESSAWQTLADRLREQIATIQGEAARPIGKWLGYDVVLQAYEWSEGILARAAERVGLPDTTFVRRLRQAQTETVNIRYPDSWSSVRAAVHEVLREPPVDGSAADRIDDLLFTLVVADVRVTSRAAALLGISAPTLKRRLSELSHRQACA